MEYLTGCYTFVDGCSLSCARFREDATYPIICGYCGHDISAHEVFGFVLDGKVELISKVTAPVP
jgi:hypothetical protein